MAVAVKQKAFSQDVINDNQNYKVPESIYDKSLFPILKELKAEGITDPKSIKFDPSKHIAYSDGDFQKTKRYTLEELGLKDHHQEPISEIGVSEPFPLFTLEAITIMRYELFQKDLILKCARASNQSNSNEELNFSVGDFTKDLAPFTNQAWTNPRTMEILSKMAGTEVLPLFPSLTAATNLSLRSESSAKVSQRPEDFDNPDEIPGVVTWHFDSPQFVCVLMLSDTTKMIGGETSLVKGDGKVAKVANPKQGWANVLQGRVVKHIAPKPAGEWTERITQVTGLRPVDPLLDGAILSTIKPSAYSNSRYNEFYKDWMNLRLDVLIKRAQYLKDDINTSIDKGEKFDQINAINFMKKKLVEYIEHSWQEFEVVDDGIVEKPASYNVKQSMWF
ncbi:hypothetical protein BN7_741 [Wickerhamomyces ciferrii]|uniref:Uncharacterized protein n=1 Tax=Wickerhamomyces ciferrii (strain ATCC 14091 / BCRC 22168 / CBS 111 / JCM 3599 / NBRC 0793 / NRRL Y-1031 F-60-10) TaxID=1206466 RepID=K0KII6_WICCF|nr:uncharacterized protein BN7_741 [Wickerhamomyces ciferrii]CCH41204.1 hypothetical protein BN7_741 [Wickerhamomyces ciferrii]